nr:thioesterase domain-containing protein [Robbsia andropogonis]
MRVDVVLFPLFRGGTIGFSRLGESTLTKRRYRGHTVARPGGQDNRAALYEIRAIDSRTWRSDSTAIERVLHVFGHSLGGLVCYELSCWLIAQGLPVPRHLFISAIRAPHCSRRARTLHDLPDAELVDELRRLNGTPKAILDNPALLGFFLPALRADLALSETYVHHATAPLDIPITVFSGQRDPYVDADEISAWHGHTEHAFSWHRMDGDHFYINTPARTTVLFETLQRTIAAMLSIERTEA